MACPRVSSDSRGRGRDAQPQTHPEGAVTGILSLSTVNRCESSGSRRTDARRVWGVPQCRELVMNFGEERGRAVVEGLMAPRYKPLVQPATRWLLRRRDHSSPSSLTALVMTRMSSSSALSLALREEG